MTSSIAREFIAITVTIDDGVATITMPGMTRRAEAISKGSLSNEYHEELSTALAELREDESVRVIVITGEEDGVFMTSGAAVPWLMKGGPDRGYAKMGGDFGDFTGTIRHTQLMIEIEKPIIAKVNGHAWGPGASIMFAADLIVIADDATVGDSHMAIDELKPMVKKKVVPPGDGGAVFAPLFFSPAIAKEYLLLGRNFTGAELARMGAVNYSAPLAELDGIVADLVARLKRRPPLAVALTKRAASRMVAEHANLTMDVSAGYESYVMLLNSLNPDAAV